MADFSFRRCFLPFTCSSYASARRQKPQVLQKRVGGRCNGFPWRCRHPVLEPRYEEGTSP
eukprot:1545704-Lingulodinium_polyedra.AAC.1